MPLHSLKVSQSASGSAINALKTPNAAVHAMIKFATTDPTKNARNKMRIAKMTPNAVRWSVFAALINFIRLVEFAKIQSH